MKNQIKNKKVKGKQLLMLCFCIFFLFFVSVRDIWAYGSATVSWTAPTTDQGGGVLTGLTGYRVYYDTQSRWASTCSLLVGEYEDVPSGDTEEYFFNTTLTAGETYYFTVVAYDGTPNISGCAHSGSNATEVSKLISYSGDIEGSDHDVDIFDYNILHNYYGTNNATADIDKNGAVNIFDYNILKEDYGSSF